MNLFSHLPVAITVCDAEGVILQMNDQAARIFKKDGGYDLLGKSLLDCHPEPARSKLMSLLKNRTPNTYTIEKNGVRKMIHQTPWYKKGQFVGLVEFSFEIPSEIPHFLRSST